MSASNCSTSTPRKRVPVDSSRWPGVYKLELKRRYKGRNDVAYTITFKDPVTGKKVWEKIGTRSEGITPQLCAEIRADRTKNARHGREVKTSKEIQREQRRHNRPLGEIANAYFDARQNDLKGIKTDRNRWAKHLDALFGKRRVSEISVIDVQRLKSSMNSKAPATIWNSLELLRRLCNWGERCKMSPPLSFTISMPERDNEVEEYLTPEQAKRLDQVLREWGNQDAVRMLQLAMLTGMRRGEIFKLKDEDVDWLYNLITISKPKGGKTVTIPLSPPVAELLREQIAHRDRISPGSYYIFPGRNGKRRVDCSAVKRIKAAASLPRRFRIFHGQRHHFAITLANSGEVDLSMIGQLLTHKSDQMTKRYAKYLPETVQKASEFAANLVRKSVSGNVESGTIISMSHHEEVTDEAGS